MTELSHDGIIGIEWKHSHSKDCRNVKKLCTVNRIDRKGEQDTLPLLNLIHLKEKKKNRVFHWEFIKFDRKIPIYYKSASTVEVREEG